MIENKSCIGQMIGDGASIGWRHIHSNSFDSGPGTTEPFPKGLKRPSTLAVTNEYDCSGFQIHNDRQIRVSFANTYFINGAMSEFPQFRTTKPPHHISLLNMLDHLPTYFQMQSDILNGHRPAQLTSVALKILRLRSPRISKPTIHLTHNTAMKTKNTLNSTYLPNRHVPNGQRTKSSLYGAAAYELCGSAIRTSAFKVLWVHGKDNSSLFVGGIDGVIATNAECVLQETGGHDGFPPYR